MEGEKLCVTKRAVVENDQVITDVTYTLLLVNVVIHLHQVDIVFSNS